MWLSRFGGLDSAEFQQDTKYYAKYYERPNGQYLILRSVYGLDRAQVAND